MVKLSIVIPAYNEERTLKTCIERVLAITDEEVAIEIIVVNDGSDDGTVDVAEAVAKEHGITVLSHPVNRGKGAALRTGFQVVTGDIVAVQDADLECHPRDLRKLIKPISEGWADVTFGSRFVLGYERRVPYIRHYVANKCLTLWSNAFSGLTLSDMGTCYKLFRSEVIHSIYIEENRFGVDAEIVAKIAKIRVNGQGVRIHEMGISYCGRTYKEGKKIGWKDFVARMVRCR